MFIDLETVGTDVEYHPPIEVGVAIIERDNLQVVGAYEWAVHLEEDVALPTVVRDMHTKNGLLDDCYDSVLTIEDVDRTLAIILDGFMNGNHMPFAGSGVLHFDRKFITRWMPMTNKRITYWAYDVGVVRRFSQWAGGKVLNGSKTHRALGDALWHAQEAAFYMQLLKVGSKYYDER
jgi:oligoribonuclease (3'-5' exoribonuclease)